MAVKHLAVVLAYGLFAVATALLLPGWVGDDAKLAAGAVGAAVFALGAVAHAVVARRDRDAAVADQLLALRAASQRFSEELALLREESRTVRQGLAEATEGVEQRAEQHLEKVVSEVRVLQSLITQLSSARAAGAARGAGDLRMAAGGGATILAGPGLAEPRAEVRTGLDHAQILDLVRDALKRDRVDLYLQPIVSLPQRKPRFYEGFSRIRDESGAVILPDQYIDVARDDGLLRAIDNMLLFRCVQLVRKAQRHNHNLGFFCNISVHTLGDRAFFREFVEFMADNRELASQLTFEFAQEDIVARWADVSRDLYALSRMGFYFSMDQVKRLDLDAQELARRHFKFVKIDAATLANAEVDVRGLKRNLDRNGIDLIVSKLETEAALVEMLDFNIDFGQGYLFGEPRLSREG